MKKKVSVYISILLLLFLNGCKEDDIKSDIEMTTSGEEIFTHSCIQCHSTDVMIGGSYKLQATKLHKDYSEKEKLHNFVQKNMPEDAPGSLSTEEYNAVVDYIWNSK